MEVEELLMVVAEELLAAMVMIVVYCTAVDLSSLSLPHIVVTEDRLQIHVCPWPTAAHLLSCLTAGQLVKIGTQQLQAPGIEWNIQLLYY
jgi:hypothetical protein